MGRGIRFLALALLCLPRLLSADGTDLAFGGPVAPQAGRLGALLSRPEGRAIFPLPDGVQPPDATGGAWTPQALQAALGSYGPLPLRWGGGMDDSDQGPRVEAQGLPRVLLLENAATIAPFSHDVEAWGWPAGALTVRSFKDVEAAPGALMDPGRWDAVVVESPADWGQEGDEPSGPSRMDDAVAQALRDYVRRGGTALFVDISQWDVDKLWPASLDLVNSGPYAESPFSATGAPGQRGKLSLSIAGDVADRVPNGQGIALIGNPNFTFVDGSQGPVYAAWAMPDPDGGTGWVAGLGYDTFDQSSSCDLAPAAQRLFLNLLLLSGRRRVLGLGGTATPGPSPTHTVPPTPTLVPTDTSVPPSPTAVPPTPTSVPTDTPVPPTPTAVPTDTSVPPTPTAIPTDTPVPPSPTSVPPTPTSVPPAPTPIPPTPTSIPTAIFVPFSSPAAAAPLPRARAALPPPAAAPQYSAPLPASSQAALRAWPTPAPRSRARVPRRRRKAQRHRAQRRAPVRPSAPPPPAVALPTAVPAAPAPTLESVRGDLGCLSTDPEPFGQGGVYLEFCLGRAAWVKVEVLDYGGKPVWRTHYRFVRAGRMQWWYPGTLASGKMAPPGSYAYVVTAYFGPGMFVTREGSMTRGDSQ